MALPIDLRMGGRRRRLMGGLQTVGVLILLAAIASIPLAVGLNTFFDHRSLTKEWTRPGPACPVVAKISAAARGAKPPAPFTYLGTHFAYQIGDVECADVPAESVFDPSHHTVCQFDAAGAIEVTTAGRTTIFEPGVGHGAMVTVRKGQVSCVVAGSGPFHGPEVGRRLQQAQDRDVARWP